MHFGESLTYLLKEVRHRNTCRPLGLERHQCTTDPGRGKLSTGPCVAPALVLLLPVDSSCSGQELHAGPTPPSTWQAGWGIAASFEAATQPTAALPTLLPTPCPHGPHPTHITQTSSPRSACRRRAIGRAFPQKNGGIVRGRPLRQVASSIGCTAHGWRPPHRRPSPRLQQLIPSLMVTARGQARQRGFFANREMDSKHCVGIRRMRHGVITCPPAFSPRLLAQLSASSRPSCPQLGRHPIHAKPLQRFKAAS